MADFGLFEVREARDPSCDLSIFEVFETAEGGEFDLWGDGDLERSDGLKDVIDKALYAGGLTLRPVGEDCVGGTYFVVDGDRKKLAVFKPFDEEAAMPGNPKGNTSVLKIGFKPGHGYLREIAAYQLDHGGYAAVPETIEYSFPGNLLGRKRPVKGSLQRFVQHDLQSWDTPPGRFCEEAVRRIAVLDLRLLNCDRHGGNVLVDFSNPLKGVLVPIDHGYTLPATSIEELDFEWMLWPQAKTHFTQREKQYVASLDVATDGAILSTLSLPPRAIAYQKLATIALQRGVLHNLTPYQIGSYFRRAELSTPSMLEEAILQAGSDLCLFRSYVDKQLKMVAGYC